MQILKMPDVRKKAHENSGLIGGLLAALEKEKVGYCHWKSNWRIERWLDGDGDLDLLVKREDVERFTSILSGLGFKKALPPAEKDLPGIINFYGYDVGRGKFVHVHAHYRMVFGHDMTKNYYLPVEDVFIDTAVSHGAIRIAAPEMELIMFVIRMILKYSPAESLARHAFGKLEKHNRSINEEIEYLRERSDMLLFKTILRQHFPMISTDLFEECLAALNMKGSEWQKISAKRALQKSLSAYSRMPQISAFALTQQRRLSAVIRKLRRISQRKTFENGGSLVAIVGGDGAGKTTCVNDIYKWLSKKFDAKKMHMGKPRKSLPTQFVAGMLKLRRMTGGNSGENGFLQQLRWLCTARDRYHTFRKIRRFAANGGIVICDRYPVPNLNLMDSPRIVPSAKKLSQLLAKKEHWYYSQIMPPDALFVLRVDPQTAVARKTDEPEHHVFTRSTELWNFNWRSTNAELIDAGQPLETVLGNLRESIWKAL